MRTTAGRGSLSAALSATGRTCLVLLRASTGFLNGIKSRSSQLFLTITGGMLRGSPFCLCTRMVKVRMSRTKSLTSPSRRLQIGGNLFAAAVKRADELEGVIKKAVESVESGISAVVGARIVIGC